MTHKVNQKNQEAEIMIDYSSYEININFEKQNLNRKAWKSMTEGVPLDSNLEISDEVLNGWIRSQRLGIDPQQRSVSKVISHSKLENLKQDNKLILDFSRPALENLIAFVYGSGFNVAISDKHGIILEVFGDTISVELAKDGNWVPGADWGETSIGNNGIGTSLYLKKPILLIGYEHYSRCCHHWASAVAPIFDHYHNPIGSIALCGRFEKIHPHTLGMIVAAAHDIEMQISLRDSIRQRELASEYQNILVNSISDGVLGTDMNGNITFCNQKSYMLLHAKPGSLLGINIESLVGRQNNLILRNSVKGIVDKEIIFNIGDGFIKCICSSSNIYDTDNIKGSVITIRDYEAAVKNAHKLLHLKPKWEFSTMIGRNRHHLDMVNLAKVSASSDRNVLILGESGTGKDVFAQSIHNESDRKSAPYVAINCGAIPNNLIASELFGYNDGAFTGAKKGGHKGKFEMANGGTIFLDEIGEMPMDQQVVLLRVLEESSFTRVGSSEKIPLDVRVIAATSKNIIDEIRNHRFRQDLFYRLNIFVIHTVPLRNRKDDLEILANSYLQKISSHSNFPFHEISIDVLSLLMNYDWPGNVRELQNVLDRALAFSSNGLITQDMINIESLKIDAIPMQKTLEMIPIIKSIKGDGSNILKSELDKNNWNITATCKILDISRPTLYRWIEKYNLKDSSKPPNFHI